MSELRKIIRQKRRSLTLKEQKIASQAILSHFKINPFVQSAQHIALYLATDGEIDTSLLIEQCWQQGKQVYLPILHPFSKGNLLFLLYHQNSMMRSNRFGIKEPKLDSRSVIATNKLDLICAPLVAFDDKGNRLGMGGGYYDRTFNANPRVKKIGLAHDCQLVDEINTQAWDVSMPEILTPSKHWVFSPKSPT